VRDLYRRRGRHRAANREAWWAADGATMWGLELPIRKWRRQVVHLKRPSDVSEADPAVVENIHSPYLRQETGQLILVGQKTRTERGLIRTATGSLLTQVLC